MGQHTRSTRLFSHPHRNNFGNALGGLVHSVKPGILLLAQRYGYLIIAVGRDMSWTLSVNSAWD